ncbi:hypothetical protein H6G20_09730 [Desertifilum sp. FACHB-1129]|uniref:Uncharacterized protein n=1 Tax=Desertifilum tharense IPPAS B-1220 TaxID=1781255 RepID=A0A1E5QEZ8_9CYAN|nr:MULTISPECIES: hypothetical protein [Desertifilum]MCD8489901.1 hypothetical protein [Desertifilum sp.]MDA0211707.1 hypothetical protein [Cyanobacteria bacterium FC1]MDK3157828.1 hypothetical protein [Kamptonema cortianum]MBD2311937.1 hypothetical protein [Desertifilum sp. FACHB-1129]MBD2322389.1 hypothetical protein [Desertifilum sp. FACHB-866]
MSDVVQWLAQIKELKEQLAQAQQERDEAYATASNWQRLYDTEAQQRRTDAHLARSTLEELQLKLQEVQGDAQLRLKPASNVPEAIAQELENLEPEQLKQRLVEAIVERDRALQEAFQLTETLKAEQASHAQTRKSLTSALGDAIDQLAKYRAQPPKEV